MDPEWIAKRREARLEFLRRLYAQTQGSVSDFADGLELGEELALESAETRRVIDYLAEKGLVKVDDHRQGIIRITALGIDHVEERLG